MRFLFSTEIDFCFEAADEAVGDCHCEKVKEQSQIKFSDLRLAVYHNGLCDLMGRRC